MLPRTQKMYYVFNLLTALLFALIILYPAYFILKWIFTSPTFVT